jgi:thioesterase domain-containing protein
VGRPELTAERFVPYPFIGVPGSRMYRTGDIARVLEDGSLDLLGRVDQQVKIRGHRIELAEIEHTLSSHPTVRSAVVTTWEAGPRDVRLAAYVIPRRGAVVDPDELRAHLRGTLPAYMIPAAYVAMDSFPLTPSKKISRNELPPPTAATTARTPSRRPTTPLQADLARVWSDVLGRTDISIDDDFFDLGGHSLLAIRVFAAMERSTGRRLPLSTLFQAPTIEELALRYEGTRTADIEVDDEWTSLIAVQPEGTRPPFFYVSPFLISILSFSHLARCMQPDQPFFLFQPQGMEGDHPVHDRIEDMAAHYISEMRQVQESGPYRIGGHCAGSWVAFEMACQLQRQGEEVALLLAVDSEPPGVSPPPVPLRHVVGRLRSYWRDGALRESLSWQLRVRRERYFSRRFGTGETQRLAAVRYAHAEAHRRYLADAIFDGDLVLVRSEDWARRHDKDWHLQWHNLVAGELILDTVDGSHGDLVADTTAAILAEKIRAAVDRSATWLWLLPLVLAPALTG